MPPLPKHPSARRRTNKVAGATVLHLVPKDAKPAAPKLPTLKEQAADGKLVTRKWHAQTRAWWADLWASPMSGEYDESDLHGLLQLAVLVDDFWHAPTSALAAEIRLQRQCFGLTPIDRRRLQWEIDRGDEAAARTEKRRQTGPASAKQPSAKKDPRQLLGT